MPSGPRPAPPDHVLRIAVGGAFDTARWANVFWVKNGAADEPTQVVLEAFLTDFCVKYGNNFKGYLSTSWHLTEANCLYYNDGGVVMGASAAPAINGTVATAVMPANIALCISWRIASHYRGGHPRTYLCGLTTNRITTSTTFDTAFTALVAASANTFRDQVNALTYGDLSSLELGTVSFQNDNQWRDNPVFRAYMAAGASIDSRVDSQRRRLGPDR